MSTAKSLLSYSMMQPLSQQTRQIHLNQFKSHLLNQAEIFLEGAPVGQWIPVYMIPENIKSEVIELLDQGTVTFRRHSNYKHLRVIDNEDFSEFKLVPGVGTLKMEGFGI